MKTLLNATLLVVLGLMGTLAAAEQPESTIAPITDNPLQPPADVTAAAAADAAADQPPLVEIVNSDGKVLGSYGELLAPDGAQQGLTIADLDSMSFEDKLALYNSVVEEKDRIVCRYEAPTGTRVEREVCRTVWQMEIERRWAQDKLAQAQRMGSLFPFGFRPDAPPTN